MREYGDETAVFLHHEEVGRDVVDLGRLIKNTARAGLQLTNYRFGSLHVLQLNSKTAIRFMFLADPSLQEITASCMGEALEWTRSGNYISVIVDDISAKDLDEIYTLTVSDGTDTIEVSYSPMTYCRNVQNGSRSVYSPELKALASALYVYNQAANIYFGET